MDHTDAVTDVPLLMSFATEWKVRANDGVTRFRTEYRARELDAAEASRLSGSFYGSLRPLPGMTIIEQRVRDVGESPDWEPFDLYCNSRGAAAFLASLSATTGGSFWSGPELAEARAELAVLSVELDEAQAWYERAAGRRSDAASAAQAEYDAALKRARIYGKAKLGKADPAKVRALQGEVRARVGPAWEAAKVEQDAAERALDDAKRNMAQFNGRYI